MLYTFIHRTYNTFFRFTKSSVLNLLIIIRKELFSVKILRKIKQLKQANRQILSIGKNGDGYSIKKHTLAYELLTIHTLKRGLQQLQDNF